MVDWVAWSVRGTWRSSVITMPNTFLQRVMLLLAGIDKYPTDY